MVVNSATGVKRRFYHRFALFLAENGFEVVTYDYRGIGDSRPVTLNKFKAFMHEWGQKDFAGVLEWGIERNSAAKVFLVGHSVGGQILGLADNNNAVSAAFLVACQSGYWGHWPLHQRYLIWILWHIFLPFVTVLCSYFPSKWMGLGENLPAGVAYEWASWGREKEYILAKQELTSRQNFKRFSGTILSCSIDRDFFAPKAAVDRLAAFYCNAKVVRRHFTRKHVRGQKFGHFDFFRERFRASLWRECVDWFRLMLKEEE